MCGRPVYRAARFGGSMKVVRMHCSGKISDNDKKAIQALIAWKHKFVKAKGEGAKR